MSKPFTFKQVAEHPIIQRINKTAPATMRNKATFPKISFKSQLSVFQL